MTRTVGAADRKPRKRRSFNEIRTEARKKLLQEFLKQEQQLVDEVEFPPTDEPDVLDKKEKKEEEEEEFPPVPDAPSDPEIIWPAHLIFVATIESGKTTAARYIMRKHKHEFDNIFVVTGNKHEGEWDDVTTDTMASVTEGFLENLQEHCIETGAHVCVVMDDPIGMSGWDSQHSPMLNKIATGGRHHGGGVSIVYLCQRFTRVPNLLRDNSKYQFLGNVNDAQIDTICKEIANPRIGQKGMRAALVSVAKDAESYKFLVNDCKRRRTRLWAVPKSGATYVGTNKGQHDSLKAASNVTP